MTYSIFNTISYLFLQPATPIAKESKSGIPRIANRELSRETSKVESVVSQKSGATYSEPSKPTRTTRPNPATKWRSPSAHPNLPAHTNLPQAGRKSGTSFLRNFQGEVIVGFIVILKFLQFYDLVENLRVILTVQYLKISKSKLSKKNSEPRTKTKFFTDC